MEMKHARQTRGFHSAFFTLLFDPMGTNPTHACSVNKLSISTLMFLKPQKIHLLDRSKIIPHLIKAFELYAVLWKMLNWFPSAYKEILLKKSLTYAYLSARVRYDSLMRDSQNIMSLFIMYPIWFRCFGEKSHVFECVFRLYDQVFSWSLLQQ